eukprot:EG_transcript_35066
MASRFGLLGLLAGVCLLGLIHPVGRFGDDATTSSAAPGALPPIRPPAGLLSVGLAPPPATADRSASARSPAAHPDAPPAVASSPAARAAPLVIGFPFSADSAAAPGRFHVALQRVCLRGPAAAREVVVVGLRPPRAWRDVTPPDTLAV